MTSIEVHTGIRNRINNVTRNQPQPKGNTMSNVIEINPATKPKLFVGSRPTNARHLLIEGIERGVLATTYGGWSNKSTLDRLVDCGWMEVRRSGPRGGAYFHTTRLGALAVGINPDREV